MFTKLVYIIVLLAAFTYAAVDPYATVNPEAKLTKPPLEDDLDYLKAGMIEALGPVAHNSEQWAAGVIPADCKSLAEGEQFSAADLTAYQVTYADVSLTYSQTRP